MVVGLISVLLGGAADGHNFHKVWVDSLVNIRMGTPLEEGYEGTTLHRCC